MATPKRAGLPSFWSTTIAKVLAGDMPCLLSPWHRGHYNWPKRPQAPSMALWKAKHTDLLQQTHAAYRAEGWRCQLESFFKVEGGTAVVSGKADLICQQKDKRPLIVDVKTGDPRESDVIQVLLEMVMIPLAWGSPSMQFAGRVIYAPPLPAVDLTPAQATEMAPRIFAMLKKLGTMPQPEPSPGEHTCQFCEIPDGDCDARWKANGAPVATSMEF